MQNNKTLKDKYAHLEFSILPLSKALKDNETKRLDSEYFKKEHLENEEAIKSQFTIKNFTKTRIQNIKSLHLNKNFNYLQISDIDTNNGLKFSTTQIDFKDMPDRATYVLHNGDVCVSTVRPNRNAVALINNSKRLIGTSGFCVLRIKDKTKLSPEILYIFCKTNFFITKMMRANTASLYPAVIDSDVLKCQIPLFDSSFQAEIEKIVKDSHHKLEQSKSLYKEAESLLYESLGSPNLACSEVNSSLGNHCIDLVFSHEARTQSPLTLCKNAKNSTSKTADTRILGETQSDSAKDSGENNPVFANAKQSIESAESTKDFNIMDCHANPCGLSRNDASLSSLRGQRPKQSINKNNSCEAQPPLAPLRGSEIEEQGGSSASALLELEADKARLSPKSVPKACKRSEAKTSAAVFRSAFASHQPLARCVGERGGGAALFAKKSDYINENISAESRRSERVESFTKNTELQGDSSHSMQSTLQNFKAKFSHLNISVKPLSKSLQKSGRLDSEYYQAKYENIEALIKQNGFKTLQEICSLINYGSVPTSPYTNSSDGVPYIKGLNLKNLEVSEDKLDKITNTQGLHSKFFTKENDIIISQMGTVGDCGVVSKSQENYIFASFTIRVRLKDTKEFNPYFVALYIQNIAKEHYLQRNIAQASVRQNTDLPTIKNLYVPLVDSQTQEQIASRLKLSFALKKEAKELLDLAKSKVECAIEGKIS